MVRIREFGPGPKIGVVNMGVDSGRPPRNNPPAECQGLGRWYSGVSTGELKGVCRGGDVDEEQEEKREGEEKHGRGGDKG